MKRRCQYRAAGISWLSRWLTAPAILVGFAPAVWAMDQVVIVATDRGDGVHQPDNLNYAAGVDRINQEFRNWFVFDFSSLEGRITSMTLHLGVPGALPNRPRDPESGGYRSNDPSELYELFSVETPIDDLVGGTGGRSAFKDLGSGFFFGDLVMKESQEGEIVSIVLNANALSNANDARRSGMLWAIGGAVPTASRNGREEIVFAGSHSEPLENTFLTVEVIPAPATGMLLVLAGMTGRRRRRSV